ncbi:hypothetical protein pb186bvf_015770 [Paramecium bursaria]
MAGDQVTCLLQHLNYSVDEYQRNFSLTAEPYSPKKKIIPIIEEKIILVDSHLDYITNPQILSDPNKQRRMLRQYQRDELLPKIMGSFSIDRPLKKAQPKQHKPLRGSNYIPKYIVPRDIRLNPFHKQKKIQESKLREEGLFQLINKGCISKDVDISPAFEKSAILTSNYLI